MSSIIKQLLTNGREVGNSPTETDDAEDDSRVDISLLGNILECQLEEGQATEEWSHALDNWERNDAPTSAEAIVWPYRYPMYPLQIHPLTEGSLPVTTKNLLCHIKLCPRFTKTKNRSLKELHSTGNNVLDDLMMKLRNDQYLEKPLHWLAIKKLVLNISGCCHSGHVEDNNLVPMWACKVCKTTKPIVLPLFLDELQTKFKLSDILAVILHWAFQSNLYCVMSDTVLSITQIWEIWLKLRCFCISKMKGFLGCSKLPLYIRLQAPHIIEGAVFRYGNFLLVALLERRTRFSYIEIIPLEIQWNFQIIMSTLNEMLSPYETPYVLISDYVLFRPIVEEKKSQFQLPDSTIKNVESPGYHNLNVIQYVTNIMSVTFRKFMSKDVCLQELQTSFYELMWRERYGRTEVMAFWSLLYMMAGQHDGKPYFPPDYNSSETKASSSKTAENNNQLENERCGLPSEANNNNNNNDDDENVIITDLSETPLNFSDINEQFQKSAEVIVPDASEVDSDSVIVEKTLPSEKEMETSDVQSQNVVSDQILNETSHTPVAENSSTSSASNNEISTSNRTIVGTLGNSGSTISVSTNSQGIVDATISLNILNDDERWNSEDLTRSVTTVSQGYTQLTISNLLSIRTWPFLLILKGYERRHEIDAEKTIELFRRKLDEQRYFNSPVQWMVNHHLIHEHTKCEVCNNDSYYLTMDRGSGRLDNYCWICTNPLCSTKKPFRRLKFFTLFGFPMCNVLQLIFNWAAQSSMEDVKKRITFNEYKIRYVYWAIQKLISKVLASENPLLGVSGQIVELGFVQLGDYCVIGAMDRQTKLTRLKAVMCPIVYHASFVENVVKTWLVPYTVIVTKYKCFSFHDDKLFPMIEVPSHVNVESSTIDSFLVLLIKTLFSRFSMGSVKLEMIQAFLDEIQWRERYGMFPETAFWNIFYQISQDDNVGLTPGTIADSLPQIYEVGIVAPEVFSNTPTGSHSTTTEITIEDDDDDDESSKSTSEISTSSSSSMLLSNLPQNGLVPDGTNSDATIVDGTNSDVTNSDVTMEDATNHDVTMADPINSDVTIADAVTSDVTMEDATNYDDVTIADAVNSDVTVTNAATCSDGPIISTVLSSNSTGINCLSNINSLEKSPDSSDIEIIYDEDSNSTVFQNKELPGVVMLCEEELLKELDVPDDTECLDLINELVEEEKSTNSNRSPSISSENANSCDSKSSYSESVGSSSKNVVSFSKGIAGSSKKVGDSSHKIKKTKEESRKSYEDEMAKNWDPCCLTIIAKNTKILGPVLTDCMSFLKRPKRKKSQKDTSEKKCIVSLEEYYYARKKPTNTSTTDRNRVYTFSCTLCKKTIFKNTKVMDHTIAHSTENDVNRRHFKLKNCTFCLKQFHSKRELNIHIQLVHCSVNSLSCLICSVRFSSSTILEVHMKCNHVPSEMPFYCSVCYFRSSQHYEVLQHFRKVHKGEPHLMCPFCLKVCSPRAKTDEILYTHTYCQHLLRHQLTKTSHRCSACSLSFLTQEEVNIHLMRDHISFANKQDVFPYKPQSYPIIVMSIDSPLQQYASIKTIPTIIQPAVLQSITTTPFSPIPQSSNLAIAPKPPTTIRAESPPCFIITSTQSIAAESESTVSQWDDQQEPSCSTTSEQKDSSSVRYVVDNKCKCLECGENIDKDHFFKHLSCNCSYSTNCARAFVAHLMEEHDILPPKEAKRRKKKSDIENSCSCSCGFSSSSTDLIEEHQKSCSGQLKISSDQTSNTASQSTVMVPQMRSQLQSILKRSPQKNEQMIRMPSSQYQSSSSRFEAQMMNMRQHQFQRRFCDMQPQQTSQGYIIQEPNTMMSPPNRIFIQGMVHPNCDNFVLPPSYRTEIVPMNHTVQYVKDSGSSGYNPYMVPSGPRIMNAESIPAASNINIIHHVNQFSTNHAQAYSGSQAFPQQMDAIKINNVYSGNSGQLIVQQPGNFDMPQLEPLFNLNTAIKMEPLD